MSLARQWQGWKGLDRDTKYGNKPNRCRQNVMHQSTLEAARCDELHVMLLADPPLIADLKAHPQERFDLRVNDLHVTHYVADFVYTDAQTGEKVVEDVKGHASETYRLKVALMRACYGIVVMEVRRVRGRRR